MSDKPTEEQFEETKRQLIAHLELKCDAALIEILSRILGQGDVTMLHALGIDGRQKMLDIFIDRCQTLKREMEDAF